MRNDPQVIDLVIRARKGDRSAWDALVDRYSPLIWSICRRYQLDRTDTEDVGQAIWLRLVEQLDNLREPAALPGWLATTTQRECYRTKRARCRLVTGVQMPEAENLPNEQFLAAEDELLMAERHAALREAFADLSPGCQQLIALLAADPPLPYAEISARLGIPVGSIGPTRRRCLDKLHSHPALAALIEGDAANAEGAA